MLEQLPREIALWHLLAALNPRQIADVGVYGLSDFRQGLFLSDSRFAKCLGLTHAPEFAPPANLVQAPRLREAH
jgi:hypothetical protein